ncbi:LuxR C-terminal-related transcriptional regulator [Isoptericola halotolerans]|uniref:helix-turn-helix transcriptional regulator n=1 Tax=Isoptericola halotolerans TaxID=300560 RepID=UPI00388F2167
MDTAGGSLDTPERQQIEEALRTGDVHAVERYFDEQWYAFPAAHASGLIRFGASLDAAVLTRRPRLLHALLLATHHTELEADDPHLRTVIQEIARRGRGYAAQLERTSSLKDLVSMGTIAVISTRLHGDYAESLRIGAWVDRRASAMTPDHAVLRSAELRPGWLASQRALTALLAGDVDRASELNAQAYAESGPRPHAHYAGANAAANLALICSYRGHLSLARSWAEKNGQMGPLTPQIEHLTSLGATIARALCAMEEGRPAPARALLDEIGPPTQRVELWPFVAYAWATFDSAYGDPAEGAKRLDEARTQHGAGSPDRTTMTGELVYRSEAVLESRIGPGSRVVNLARALDHPWYLDHHLAWAHLGHGDDREAVRVASRALHSAGPTRPLADRIGLHLAGALGRLGLGEEGEARREFLLALGLRSTAEHVRPFLAARNDDLARLCRVAGVDPVLPRSDLVTNPVRFSRPVQLTPREREVLRLLDEDVTAAGAARALYVSPATVRTQFQSIYKKLGVSSRLDALARAHMLGLVHDATPGPR